MEKKDRPTLWQVTRPLFFTTVSNFLFLFKLIGIARYKKITKTIGEYRRARHHLTHCVVAYVLAWL
jgi:hypothetical protein